MRRSQKQLNEPSSSSTSKSLEHALYRVKDIKYKYHQRKKLVLMEKSMGSIVLSFPDGSPVQIPPTLIKCYSKSSDGSFTNYLVEDTGQPGHYVVAFTSITRGAQELYIKINGTDITDRPISIPVSIPPSTRNLPIKVYTGLKYPYAVEIMRSGEIIVTEYFSNRITFLDQNGKRIKSIGTAGRRKGEFNHPCGIAVTPRGTVLVADRDNNRIQEISITGECLSCIGKLGTRPLQFRKPEGVAVNQATGMVYVADTYNHRIQVLNPDFSFSDFIGGLGSGLGQFKHPFSMTFDSKGFMYVTDRCNNRLQKFTPDGRLLTILGSQLDNPTGIAVDDNGILYVCEYETCLVTALTTEGELVKCELQGRVKGPYGIKFNPRNGDIIVCDTRNNRLLVF